MATDLAIARRGKLNSKLLANNEGCIALTSKLTIEAWPPMMMRHAAPPEDRFVDQTMKQQAASSPHFGSGSVQGGEGVSEAREGGAACDNLPPTYLLYTNGPSRSEFRPSSPLLLAALTLL
ncbi:hypothetical protein BP6252_05144 [Coleophoma cylindrospora]|uniref:Uncharacterized protein n=1 Tax=Coleophoma cylindrospora TaxID=1849047 RepID=A0A3D8RTF0_9HELO|nr:hypothetical protein BP6252_05144 [Coleophoma cylindrospora]